MRKTLEIFFDFLSPPSYLAWTQIPSLLERTGAAAVWRPMFTLGLHELTGNRSPVTVPNKAKWIMGDLQLYARKYDVPFNPNLGGFINILPADRAAAFAETRGEIEPLAASLYPAMWVHGRDLSDLSVLGELIDAAGLPSNEYLTAIETDAVKDRLKANTQEAADRDAFGAPTFFVDGRLFFGQDRLHFVEDALSQ